MTLPVLSPRARIVNPDGTASRDFLDWIRKADTSITDADTSLQAQLDRLAQLVRAVSFPESATITGTDAGSSATVAVTGHTRVYQDATVTVDAGSVTGVAYGQDSYIYYDDETNAGGTVTYAVTTDLASAVPSDTNPARHFVGTVTTPTAGNPPTSGSPAAGAGAISQ